jgi:hypothetical protein
VAFFIKELPLKSRAGDPQEGSDAGSAGSTSDPAADEPADAMPMAMAAH